MPPSFLLDRSLGQKILVSRLRDAGWQAVTLAERYGDATAQGMSDEAWIAGGAESGAMLLAKDSRIAQRPLEASAIYMNDARVITFSRGDLTAAQMGDMLVAHQQRIFRLAAVAPPFVFSLSQNGLFRKKLYAP